MRKAPDGHPVRSSLGTEAYRLLPPKPPLLSQCMCTYAVSFSLLQRSKRSSFPNCLFITGEEQVHLRDLQTNSGTACGRSDEHLAMVIKPAAAQQVQTPVHDCTPARGELAATAATRRVTGTSSHQRSRARARGRPSTYTSQHSKLTLCRSSGGGLVLPPCPEEEGRTISMVH